MSANTIEHNQNANLLPEDGQPVWLFGYGSLIYKVDFEFLEARQATLDGWKRRFWQGSHDHRGTPEHPGRVVTLMPDAQARCTGIAYRVSPDVFSHLDVREKNGYLRLFKPLALHDGDTVDALVYIATEDNPASPDPRLNTISQPGFSSARARAAPIQTMRWRSRVHSGAWGWMNRMYSRLNATCRPCLRRLINPR